MELIASAEETAQPQPLEAVASSVQSASRPASSRHAIPRDLHEEACDVARRCRT